MFFSNFEMRLDMYSMIHKEGLNISPIIQCKYEENGTRENESGYKSDFKNEITIYFIGV